MNNNNLKNDLLLTTIPEHLLLEEVYYIVVSYTNSKELVVRTFIKTLKGCDIIKKMTFNIQTNYMWMLISKRGVDFWNKKSLNEFIDNFNYKYNAFPLHTFVCPNEEYYGK